MGEHSKSAESLLALSVDLFTARLLVWVARVGRNAELTPEAHLYFFDRYSRLADCHRAHGHLTKAKRLQARAEDHYRAGGAPGGPPYAAAMAMPRPTRFVRTEALGRGPDDAA